MQRVSSSQAAWTRIISPTRLSPASCLILWSAGAAMAIALAPPARERHLAGDESRYRTSNGGSARALCPMRTRSPPWSGAPRRSAPARRASSSGFWSIRRSSTAGTSAAADELLNPMHFPVHEAGRGGPLHLSRPWPARWLSHARPRTARPRHPPLRAWS
jgi:hypothetical protein